MDKYRHNFKSDNELSWKQLYEMKKQYKVKEKKTSEEFKKENKQENWIWFEITFKDGEKSLYYVENTEERKKRLKEMGY